MKKRIRITEEQSHLIENFIAENDLRGLTISHLKNEVDRYYEPEYGVVKTGGEFSNKVMVKSKIDGSTMSAQRLLDYLSFKYPKYSVDFLKQFIVDWMSGNIVDGRLTSNISMA